MSTKYLDTKEKFLELLLLLLLLKHAFADLFLQSFHRGINKEHYIGNGHRHYLEHGMLTIITLFLFVSPEFAFLAGTIDYLAHWHIDFLKHRIISYFEVIRDGKVFWSIQAIDQCLHFCTYYLIVVLLVQFYS